MVYFTQTCYTCHSKEIISRLTQTRIDVSKIKNIWKDKYICLKSKTVMGIGFLNLFVDLGH